ncbi:MAG TPA: sulfotransferase [Candidatus Binataceae bacterium]|nr:sulfotransferase [Candidatus Binataceae bacterium]
MAGQSTNGAHQGRGEQPRRLPDFIGVGPARTGTTWLHHALASSVVLPKGTKETSFFSSRYGRGIDWYAWHFRAAGPGSVVGEVCPYFAEPKAPERVAKHLPGCKIICTVRDPVERAWSFYRMGRYYGALRRSFEESLTAQPNIAEGSRYAFHLTNWFQRLGRESVLVTFYDELHDNPQAYLDRICGFIGIEPIRVRQDQSAKRSVNAIDRPARNQKRARKAQRLLGSLRSHRAYRTIELLDRVGLWDFSFGGGEPFPTLEEEVEQRVRERFRPEVAALEDLIGVDLSRWKRPAGARALSHSSRSAESRGALRAQSRGRTDT